MLKNKKENKRRVEGIIVETLRNALFRVKLPQEDREILAYLAGKLHLYRIKILPGDKVLVELSPYDPQKGRIIYRL